MSANTAQKLPNTDIQVEYPWAHVTQTIGGHEVIYNNTPDHESIRQAHAFGTFKEWGPNGAERRLVANSQHHVITQGKSTSVEGVHDNYAVGGSRHVSMGDVHNESIGDHTTGVGGHSVHVASGDGHHFFNGGKSSSMTGDDYIHYIGDDENTVNHHNYYSGDHTQFIKGNHYQQLDGEHGTYLSSGNMDIQLDSGKLRIKSGDDQLFDSNSKINIKGVSEVNVNSAIINITADTKITLKVGSTKIEITSSGITINSSGTIDLTATGTIKTQGSATLLQGGGMAAPPSTIS